MSKESRFESLICEQNDLVDNAVYRCILDLTGKNEDELPWDMNVIGDVTDAIESVLDRKGIYFCRPGHNIAPDDYDRETPCYEDNDCKCDNCPMKKKD